jgi:hypothetical protein
MGRKILFVCTDQQRYDTLSCFEPAIKIFDEPHAAQFGPACEAPHLPHK